MRRGFSLVELSIVLVILGLLVGGVLAGKSLIRAAEVRSVTTEYQRYTTAIHSFRDKYFYLPGDMPNAVKFWGAQAGGTADGYDATCGALTTGATSAATCNGDGNGRVSDWGVMAVGDSYEMWRLWQHLANAGLVEGSYSGVRGHASWPYLSSIGVNAPQSKVQNAGWSMVWLGAYGDTTYFTMNYGHFFSFGSQRANYFTYEKAISAEEAWGVDSKLDDGLPHVGKVVGFKNARQPDCVGAANNGYNLSSSVKVACALHFITGY